MGFLGISQLTTAAYSPAASLAEGVGTPGSGACGDDPTAFAEACTGAADSLAASGASGAGGSTLGLLGGALNGSGSSPLAGLLGLVAALFGGSGPNGAAAGGLGGLGGALPGVATTIAGLLG